MNTFTGAVISAGISCFMILLLRLLLPGRGGLGSLFIPEHEQNEGPKLGGVFLLAGLIAGMLAGGASLSGNSLFALLITAASVLIGFVDDMISLQDRRGEGIVPWLKGLLVFLLMLSAALYLAFSEVPGQALFLPISCASADLNGWYILLALPLLLGRLMSEKKLCESAGDFSANNGYEAAFWCFVFCIAAQTGAGQWFQYRDEFHGMAIFSGSAAGSVLGISVFNTDGKALRLGASGYFGIATALSLMALSSGWLILLPFAALWPFCCAIYALIKRVRAGKNPVGPTDLLLADYFTGHGMTVPRLQSTIRWLSLLGLLTAAVLYMF